MVFNIFPLIIIILSFLAILYIIGRKIPELRLIDVSSITEVKESSMKKKLIEIRWKRVLSEALLTWKKLLKPLVGKMFYLVRNFYRKILDLEKIYTKIIQERKEEKEHTKTRLESYIAQAAQMREEGNLDSAEEYYMKALGLDDKNFLAYKGLGDTYLEKKEYAKARETLLFLVKLLTGVKLDDDVEHTIILAGAYMELAQISDVEGKYAIAIQYIKKSLEIEPNNPRFLDLLLNFSIIMKDKKLAQDTLQRLKDVNPDNQKLPELQEKVSHLSK